MSRAALLPFPGDPLLLHYWLKFFDKYWASEVDRLYIHLNSPIEKDVVDYITTMCLERKDKIFLKISHNQIEHGQALNMLLDEVTEDYVMIIEDDCFIFKSGEVDKCFKYLESGEYEIVGSKRGSCAMEILSRARMIWGLEYTGEGDQGCNFWPNLFFSSKAKLLTTDRNFGARSWLRGEEITALSKPGDQYLVQDRIASGDTFVWASLQLQATTPQKMIKYIPQYHGSPDDLDHFQRRYNLFDGQAPWVHVGSLSSGVGGLLQDGHGRSLSRRLIDSSVGDKVPIPNYCNTEQEKWEFERRVQWWLTFWEKRQVGFIDDFSYLYYQAVEAIITQYDLSKERIERRQRAYNTIIEI